MPQSAEAELIKELHHARTQVQEWEEEVIEVRPSNSTVVSFRMPRDEFALVETAASSGGLSISRFIRNAISRHLVQRPEVIWVQIELTMTTPSTLVVALGAGRIIEVVNRGPSENIDVSQLGGFLPGAIPA